MNTSLTFAFLLIHSPLTGPEVWRPMADQLRALGHTALVPDLTDSAADARPLWQQHVASAASSLNGELADPSILKLNKVLVAHSGAGPLLATIGRRLIHPPAAFLFIDAGLPPVSPATRLDLIRQEGGDWVDEFEGFLRAGGVYPNWTDANLRELKPKSTTRRLVLNTLRPRGLAYFDEILPATDHLSRLQGGYMAFTAGYEVYARQAETVGWPVERIPAEHFQLLVDPKRVATGLLALAAAAGR